MNARSHTKAFPAMHSIKHRIGRYLLNHAGATLMEITSYIRTQRSRYLRDQLTDLKADQLITETQDGRYSLTALWQKHIGNLYQEVVSAKQELTPGRDPSVYTKPWSGKYSIARPGLRDWSYARA